MNWRYVIVLTLVGASLRLIDVQTAYAAGGSVSGRVTEKDSGAALAGVELHARSLNNQDVSHTRSGRDGTFRLSGLSARTYRIEQDRLPGHLVRGTNPSTSGDPWTVTITGDEEIGDINFAQERGLRISGTVVDERGKPVARARLTGYWGSGYAASFTENSIADDDGRFALDGCEPRTKITVYAEADGLTMAATRREDREVSLEDSDVANLVLTMRIESTISGVVLDETNQPKPNVYARAIRRYPDAPGGGSMSRTDANGTFTIHGLEAGTHEVRLDPTDGAVPAEPALEVDLAAGEQKSGVRLVYVKAPHKDVPGLTISGRVVDSRGAPVRATLMADTGCCAPPLPARTPEVQTDESGRFRIEGLAEGPCSIDVYSFDFDLTEASKEVTAGTSDVEIVLADRGAICGTVVDGKDGSPVREFRVISGGIRFGDENVRDAHGQFNLSHISAGSNVVIVTAAGYEKTLVDIPPLKGGETRRGIEIRMEAQHPVPIGSNPTSK